VKQAASDERASGARKKFVLPSVREEIVGDDASSGATDPLLDAAEREGELLACIAQQDREIARLKSQLENTQCALADALEQLTLLSIHSQPTNPPPRGIDLMGATLRPANNEPPET
jgi:hypothetical protein